MSQTESPSGQPRRKRRQQRTQLPASPLSRWLGQEFGAVAALPRSRAWWLLLALALVGLVMVYQVPQGHLIDVGRPNGRDGFYLRDFFAKETVAGTTFRWTGEHAQVVLPGAAGNSDWQLTMRIAAPRPPGLAAGTPPAALKILADGREIAQFAVAPDFATYTFQLPREAVPAGDLVLDFVSTTFNPPGGGDDRQLGVQVAEIELQPLRSGATVLVPPILTVAVYLLLLVGLALFLAWLTVPLRIVLATVAVTTVAVLTGLALQPGITAFYLFSLAVITVLLFGVLFLLRPAFRRICLAGGVTLTARDEAILLGIVAFGAGYHLAGVFFPDFQAHDLIFQANRMRDILAGRFLLTSLVDQEGVRPTPYSPAVYILLAPLAKVAGGPELMLRFWMPIIEATSALPIFYLLRRCRVPDPAPVLAAFATTILAVGSQLLWWGFFSNQFGQWATLLVLALVVGHWGEFGNRWLFGLLVLVLALPLLSHPSSFVILCGFVPVLIGCLVLSGRDWRQGGLVALAFGLALLLVYLLYYRHFTALAIDYARNLSGDAAVRTTDDAPGWERNYILLRVFSLPLGLYLLATIAAPFMLWRQQRRLAWGLLAVIVTFILFAAVHVLSGLWVRYFVFLTPAEAIGTGVVLGWLWRQPRWGRVVTWALLAIGTLVSLYFWYTITLGGGRSIYP